MSRIEFKRKPRKDGVGPLLTDGSRVFIGRDVARQNDIDEAKEKTKSRGCFRACRTCGACANSQRDSSYPYSYDHNVGKNINCLGCEPNRFHDCHNGVMRDSRQEAEPFTPDAQKLIDLTGGKPLI